MICEMRCVGAYRPKRNEEKRKNYYIIKKMRNKTK